MGHNKDTDSGSRETPPDICNRDYLVGKADTIFDLRHGVMINIVTLAGNVRTVHPDQIDFSMYLKLFVMYSGRGSALPHTLKYPGRQKSNFFRPGYCLFP